jgi:DNA (cytosine-5)-methyltransferase 1
MDGIEDTLLKEKMERLGRGNRPRVLDLFSGCGGLSLGFHTAGFEIIGAVEFDPDAARSHALNLFKFSPEEVQNLHARPRNILTTEPEELIQEFIPGCELEKAIDVIIAGPPCQAFARVGRAKLREVAAHPEAFLKDPRANLYLRYLSYVKKLKPVALLIENVPDILNYGGQNISEEICETLSGMGYDCRYTILNSSYYGVPQMRDRMFLIAYAKVLNLKIDFPTPTHWVELPKGYEGSRSVALKLLRLTLINELSFFIKPPSPSLNLPLAVTAKEALGDLPPITLHLEGKLKRGARRFTEKIPYSRNDEASSYVWKMRNWLGFENNGWIWDHVIRYLPRDYAIFRRMKHGDQYPEAYEHALDLLKERLAGLARCGKPIKPDSSEYEELKRKIVPPYDTGKFPNKWRKMEPDLPARTLMAHLGKDGYSHIHYDSSQARTISVREAARLQSFPDGFVFSGTMNPAFRQIGNAVPPLLAKAIAAKMIRRIREAAKCYVNLQLSA